MPSVCATRIPAGKGVIETNSSRSNESDESLLVLILKTLRCFDCDEERVGKGGFDSNEV